MNREEAEKLANDLLSHYGRQNWDEHFKVEVTISPAKYHLVKDAQQFIAMLKRRGYTGIKEETDEHGWLCWLDSEYTGRSFVRESFFLYETVATVAERLDKWYGAGQHHMCCIQCKEPLLHQQKRGILYRGEIVPMTRELAQELRPVMPLGLYQEQSVDEYRNAKAGPDSEVLTVCPGCGLEFIKPMPVQEIRDDE